jgi:hypothetical protein
MYKEKRRSLLNSKKGDFQTLLILIIIVFGLALGLIVFSKVFLMVLGQIKVNPDIALNNNSVQTIEKVEVSTIPLLDFFIFFSLVSIIIGAIISSIYINTHPAIVVILLVAMFIAVFLAGIFTNIFAEFSANSEISSTASQFKFTNLILGQHFPIIIFIVFIIIIVILFGKARGGEVYA